MAQDNDLSNLKQRLGLNKDEEESDGDEPQQEQPQQQGGAPAGSQGGHQAGPEEARYEAQPQQQVQQPQGQAPQQQQPQQGHAPQGGPQADPAGHQSADGGQEVSHNSPTRVGPPPDQQFPPDAAGAEPQQPAGHGGGAPGGAQEFSQTTPDDGPPGGGFEHGGGPPGGGPPGGQAADPGLGSSGGLGDEPSTDFGEAEADEFAPTSHDLGSDGDLSLDESTFSTPVIVLLVVMLGIGLLFGFIGASSFQTRKLYNAQTSHAQSVLDVLEKRVANFKEVKNIVQDMNPEKVEYKKAKKLAEFDLAVNMTTLGTDKLLLGGERTAMLTSYIVQAQRLEAMIEEHNRQTNQVDKKDLEKIVGGKDEQEKKKNEQFAAVFNFDHLRRNGGKEDYQPVTGKLVTITNLEEPKEQKVQYKLPDSGRTGQVNIRGVVPLSKGDVLTVGGENAFERYQRRVSEIKHVVKKMAQRPSALVQKLKELADRGGAPLIQL